MKILRFYKTFDWVLVITSYLAAIMLYIGTVLYEKNAGTAGIINNLTIPAIVFYVTILSLQPILYIIGIIYGFTAKESMTKHNMIVKLVSVPFFIINFLGLTSFLSGIVTEYDAILMLLLMFLFIIATFSIMFRSSLPNVIYFIKNYIKKTLKVTPWAIFALIFSFIFFLDIIGGIILFNHERNQCPDIKERIKQAKLKKIEEWKSKKHMSFLLFKIVSIISSGVVTIASLLIIIMIIGDINSLFANQDSFLESLLTSEDTGNLFIFCIVLISLFSFIKFIFGLIYGRKGDEDPTKFLFIMKLVDILPTTALLLIVFLILFVGFASTTLSIITLPLIMVFHLSFIVLFFIGLSFIAYITAIPYVLSTSLFLWSTSLSLFTYYIKQREIKNKRFSSPKVVICLICLWIPIADLIAMGILNAKSKDNTIFGDKQVIIP